MSTRNELSEYKLKYFQEHLKPESYVSFRRENGEFLKGEVVSVDFENLKFTLNNDKDNRPEFNKILPISDQLRVNPPGEKHDLREVNNLDQLKRNYGITLDKFKDNLRDMCSYNSCMSKVIMAEKMMVNEDNTQELITYPTRLKIVDDKENGGKRIRQITGYTREQFLEKYDGQSTLGITVTPEMKKDLIEKGNIGIQKVSNSIDGEIKPKFIGFDPELNRVIPISVEKIKKDLSNTFKAKEIKTLLEGGTAVTKTGKTVKIDTVSYLTKGNIVKSVEEQAQKKKVKTSMKVS